MEDDIKLWAKAGHGSGVTISGDSSARLTNLTAQATLKYSMKDYNAAAELYSHATELQARINGELSPGNADLLYVYGRCLYQVAVENSDVLGSKVAGEKPTEDLKEPEKIKPLDEGNVGKAVAKVVKENTKSVQPLEEGGQGSKPYFQFSGDENFGASDEENDGGKPDEEDEDADDEDDFANAYEVLDLARVLLLRKLEETKANNSKSRTTSDSPQLQQIRERLADIYDLQAEISLEGERFGNAVTDLKSALDLKMSLFPQHSSIIAEAYYKLSLALEFSSVTQQRDENGNIEEGKHSNIDYAMREDAAKKMEAAIASCRLRIQKEESKLQDTMPVEEDRSSLKVSRHEIDDVKEMVMDMEQRLADLRRPPISVDNLRGIGTNDHSQYLAGLSGPVLGHSPKAREGRLEEVVKGANDLTNFIKKKKAVGRGSSNLQELDIPHFKEKRKAEVLEVDQDFGQGKKARAKDDDQPGES